MVQRIDVVNWSQKKEVQEACVKLAEREGVEKDPWGFSWGVVLERGP